MGLYAEPAGDKLAWIKKHGEPSAVSADTVFLPSSERLPVVLMLQGFVALGIAYNKAEVKRFRLGRPDAQWFLVPKSELRKVVPGGEKIKELK